VSADRRLGEQILFEQREEIAILRLNRPGRRNAVGPDMMSSLIQGLRSCAQSDDIRGVVLTGSEAEHAFSSGADVGQSHTHSTPADDYLAQLEIGQHPVFESLLRFPKPIIAGVSGYAIGWGFLVCLACDVIVADRSAEFRLPQVHFGVLPAYSGVARLAQWVGRGRAMSIAMLGRPVMAEEAERIGLVAELCEENQVIETACRLAQSCIAAPREAIHLMKDSMYQSMEGAIRDAAVADLYRLGLLQQTSSVRQAHEGWRTKRNSS
jgi:enoyl-CoA hydratase/carnithine racemase